MDGQDGAAIDATEKTLGALGLSLVEMSVGRRRGEVSVHVVLHKADGVSLDDLTGAQKVLRPRLELEYDRESLSLEISSPGTSRVFKDPREYGVFEGCRAKLLVGDDWRQGTLAGFDGTTVRLDTGGGVDEIPASDIRKGKLDF